jgi:hypothetical protein
MKPQEAAAAKAAEQLEPLRAWFASRPALIFAPGPSLDLLWHPQRYIPLPSIVINDAWLIAPEADVLYAADQEWWVRREAAPGFRGLRVSAEASGFRHVIPLQLSGPKGYDPRLGWLRHGSNSGYAAIHLAAQLGSSPIVLVGFDMRRVLGRNHYEGHPPELRTNASNYEGWLENFRELRRELAWHGVEILCATPGSRLVSAKVLEAVDLEDFLCRAPSAS